ncbi:hypothetical protein ciss_13340 [Carboxydothermus islandicus]|uniref:Uncharacterized protein n=1 Tax=Carboxydothermus islandicus TaxID=661089 RepID=A0A1L8D2U5_9THEO|nr:SHOCT domain-containing protein [Carboxydothermus islandicus]GAV25401.1 hypothetical protein ciss_13340 [Carboxydothermus islandicus]
MMWRFFPGYGNGYGNGYGYGFGYFPGDFLINLFILMVVIVVVIVVAIVIFKRLAVNNHSSSLTLSNRRSTAEEILKEQYARGEINREEYLKALEDLKK